MKFETMNRVLAATLLATLVIPGVVAQTTAKQHHPHQYHHYQIVDPGTFGGPSSGLQNPPFPRVGVLNNRGTLGGWANTPGSDFPYCGFGNCYAGDGFQFRDGVTTDLGKLPGGFDSQVNWISQSGVMTGSGDNGQPDPLAGFLITQIHGLLWNHGTMTDLGTLEGGYNSFALGVNSRSEVVGSAQNTVPDPNSMWPGYGTQMRAFYWKNGVMQDLGTLGTGTDAQAALINERGQVVGWSYTNSTPSAICAGQYNWGFFLTTSSFIWDKHHGMRDIGGLGGTCTLAQDLNSRGQIVGDSALTGDTLLHPFVWDSATGMTDLGTASGNYGEARAINEHGDVVGQVCDAAYTSCPAALWRKAGGKWRMTNLGTIVTGGCAKSTSVNASAQVVGTDWCANPAVPFLSEDGGSVVDLNTLVPPNSGIQLVEGVQINNRGEIAVQGPDANGNNHAVLLIPCDENHPGVEGCDYSMVDVTAAGTSAPVPGGHGLRDRLLGPMVRQNRFGSSAPK
jgi:probable HAF family extracellular repeat protein